MADERKISANIIIEILGRPPEHIKKALEELIGKLGGEQGVKVKDSKVHEPKLIQDSKEVYTTFAEVSVEFDSLVNYFGVMFAYMPANIEIVSPEKFALSNFDMNEFGNKLLARLHDYDAITKKLIYERKFLMEKLKEFAPHMFKTEPAKEEARPEEKSSETKPKKEKKSKKKN